MKVNLAVPINRLGTKGKGALLAVLLMAALIAVVVPFFGVITAAHAATGTASFDNVQVAIQTSSDLPDSYTVSAYNTTGGLLATYQSQYPAASFELPSGSYIFAATATQQQTLYYPAGLSSGTTAGAAASSSGVIVSPPIKCCEYTQPVVEYGYVGQQVSGSTSLTISTEQVNQTATSTLSIKVSYPNGTAASGVYVSASVLGDNYGWAYGSSGVSMSDTGSQGTVTLVTPRAPVLVSASTSIPIVLPFNQTTVQVTVAGEKVNVTANWEPNYVSFSGQALIVPPQTSASIVLQYQPQSDGPILYATGQTATGAATGSSGPSGVPSQTTSEQQATTVVHLPPGSQVASTQSSSSNTSIFLISGIAAAISIASLSVAVFAVKSRPKQPTN